MFITPLPCWARAPHSHWVIQTLRYSPAQTPSPSHSRELTAVEFTFAFSFYHIPHILSHVQLRFHHLGPMVWWHHFQHLPCRFFFSQAAVRFHQQFNQGKTFTDLQSVGSYLSLIHQMHRCCPTNLPFCLTCWSTCNHLPTSRTPPKSHCTETAKTPPWPSICPLSHPQFSSLSNH